MTTHSKLPPSSAARRMACPGSRGMEELYGRDDKSEASTEGDLAHELAANYIARSKFIGMSSSFTQEMHEGAKTYEDVILKFFPEKPVNDGVDEFFLPNENIHVEEYVNISNIHSEMWGTPDAWGIVDKTLHIFDYKFGFTPVEVFENWQLLAYACGIYKNHLEIKDIYLHIVQPRDYISNSKHKVWHLTTQELMSYKQRLIISEALAMSPNAPLIVSDQCKYCKARYACPALQKAAFGATELAYRNTQHALTSREIGTELKFLHEAQEILSYRITALETEAEHLLKSGMHVDHYELKPVESRLSWIMPKEDIIQMGELLGINLRKEDVITPTQAIKAGLPEDNILACAERKSSVKLSKIDTTKSKEVFKK
jgi:Protein of unknown function (DUF2800)